jgi:micrococcal nuclease
VLLAFAVGCGDASTADGTSDNGDANGTVVRIVDGDTVVVDVDGAEEKIRLIGIDTPESVDPRRPVECFGKEATAHITDLIPEGTPLRVERDVEARDRYDRLLAYLYRADDDLFVNEQMIADGYANVATYPPNVTHVDRFLEAERSARADDRGLWSACPHE